MEITTCLTLRRRKLNIPVALLKLAEKINTALADISRLANTMLSVKKMIKSSS